MKLKALNKLRYEYKGKKYKVILRSKMKIGQLWVPCVIYQSYEDNKIWVREQGDFFEKFKSIEPELLTTKTDNNG